MPTPAPGNDLGLTAIGNYSTETNTTHLRQQLDTAGITYQTVQLPAIVGMGGNAVLLAYTSPKSGRPVTVLVVPDRLEADQFGETYFYFDGLALGDALAGDYPARWADLYDRCRELV